MLLLAVSLLSATGCAPMRIWEPSIPNVHPLREERAAKVIASFEKSREDAEFRAACSYYRHGQHKDSLEALQTLVKRRPTHAAGRAMLIELLLEMGQADQAELLADNCESFDQAVVFHARGLAYQAVERHDDAWQCLEKAVALEPRNETFLFSLKSAEDATESDAAFNDSEKRAAASQTSATNNTVMISDEASIVTAPLPDSRSKLVSSSPALTAAVASPSEVEVPSNLSPDCLLMTAELCFAMGQHDEAMQRLAMVDTANFDTAANRLRSQIVAGRPELATTAMAEPVKLVAIRDEHLKLASTHEETRVAEPQQSPEQWMEQAAEALSAGRVETASAYLTKLYQQHPLDDASAVAAAILPLRHDEPELSLQLAQSALVRFPQSAALYRVQGTAQYRLERLPAARDALQRAIALDNRDALSYFLMGCTLSKLGQNDDARGYYRQAETLDARYRNGNKVR